MPRTHLLSPILGILAMALAGPTARAQDLLQEFLKFPTDESTTKKMLDAYNHGADAEKRRVEEVSYVIYHGFYWSHVYAYSAFKKEIYCIPLKGVALRPPDVIKIVLDHVKSNPKLMTTSYGLTMLLSLRARFPCDESTAAKPQPR